MINILPLSDLHLEFMSRNGQPFISTLRKDVDVVVLAGDITTPNLLVETMEEFCSHFGDVPIIYVLGNHDHISLVSGEVHRQVENFALAHKNFHWLENDFVEIKGQRFIGATLWYPQTEDAIAFQRNWFDFNYIPDAYTFIYKAHEKTRKFLLQHLKKDDILVSHMLPSDICVADEWRGSHLNCFFVAGIDDIIKTARPKLSIFGHTHNEMDFVNDGTRYVCNPRGYFRKNKGLIVPENPNFNQNLVVSV